MHVKLEKKRTVTMKMKLHLLSHCNSNLKPSELPQMNLLILISLDRAGLELSTK